VRPYQFAAGLVTCELSFYPQDSQCINVPLDLMTSGGLDRGARPPLSESVEPACGFGLIGP